MCSPLASNFWSTPVLVHKGLIHGVMTSLPWQTGLQSWQSCTIALACLVGYNWMCKLATNGGPTEIPLSEGLISYMWIQSDSDHTGSINFQAVCVTGLMCSPLAGNSWSTPEVMTPCISPLWTKTGVLQKLPANGLHISPVTHTPESWLNLWGHCLIGSTYNWSNLLRGNLGGTSICSQLNVQVQWCMTVSFGDQSVKAEKSWHHVLAPYGLKWVCFKFTG